jgi:hypothetical protein
MTMRRPLSGTQVDFAMPQLATDPNPSAPPTMANVGAVRRRDHDNSATGALVYFAFDLLDTAAAMN